MPDSTFRPIFRDHSTLFRGIVTVWIDAEGKLNAEYADGTQEVIGPATSFAYAVDAGIAGENTDYPTFDLWAQHVADMSQAASDAQAWAEGKRGQTDVSQGDPAYHNNSKYYSGLASDSATNAATSATNASDKAQDATTQAENAECWAVGTKNGEPQTSTGSSVPGTENNSKYYANQTSILYNDFSNTYSGDFTQKYNTVQSAAQSTADNAETSHNDALASEGFALGTQNGTPAEQGEDYWHDNAKYYSQEAAASALAAAGYAISSTEIKYCVTQNYSDPGSFTNWVDVPDLSNAAGKYVWARTTITVNGTDYVYYTVGYIGANSISDGQIVSTVQSVNGLGDNVILTGQNVNSSDTSGKTIYQALQELESLANSKIQVYSSSDGFPASGTEGVLYIAGNSNIIYRWQVESGVGSYVAISGGGGSGPGGIMVGATDTSSGTSGAAPAPNAGDNHKFLCGDASWKKPVTKETIKEALESSAEETKKFLNENGEWVTVDSDAFVHTAGEETITGPKKFTSSPTIVSTSERFKYLYFSNGKSSVGNMFVDSGDPTNLTLSQVGFSEFSPKSTPDRDHTGYSETYKLPACNVGRTSPQSYNILTTKNKVKIEEGGTNAGTVAEARTNLGLGAAATRNVVTDIAQSATSTNLPTAQAVAAFVEGKNYYPKSGGTISGAVTVGGSLTVNGGITATGSITGSKVYNAVWNDYAECRNANTLEPGRCVTETNSGMMCKTWERLQPGCKLTSDTFGACMGETDEAQTPIAVAGRVLAHPYRDISEYHLGDAVCSAPNGTVDVMTREEIREYPERIVGTVSEIPGYDVWYGGSKEDPKPIQVKGRIWIYVR